VVDRRFGVVPAVPRGCAGPAAAGFLAVVDAGPDFLAGVLPGVRAGVPAPLAGVFAGGLPGVVAGDVSAVRARASAGVLPAGRLGAALLAADTLVRDGAVVPDLEADRLVDVATVGAEVAAPLAAGTDPAVKAIPPMSADWTSRLATSARAASTWRRRLTSSARAFASAFSTRA